jgi:hypothetical protein
MWTWLLLLNDHFGRGKHIADQHWDSGKLGRMGRLRDGPR